MEIYSFVIGSLSSIPLWACAIFLLKKWIETRITYSIKNEYDKDALKYKNLLEVRLKAELVAELMAEWISKPEDPRKLNELSFQAFLWLPSDLAQDLSKTLSHKQGADDLRQIIKKARKHLLNEEHDFDSNNIIVFVKEK